MAGDTAPIDSLVGLVYELLDASEDVAQLADECGLHDDPRWAAHLDYLRGLQRVAREDLARATAGVAW